MLTSSLLKKKRGWSPISNDNSGLSYRPSDMGEQVSGEEKHPRGQTWAGNRVILEAAKGHGGRVAGRAQGLALRPPEPCQSRPRAGWQRAGGGWARLLRDRAPPEPPSRRGVVWELRRKACILTLLSPGASGLPLINRVRYKI